MSPSGKQVRDRRNADLLVKAIGMGTTWIEASEDVIAVITTWTSQLGVRKEDIERFGAEAMGKELRERSLASLQKEIDKELAPKLTVVRGPKSGV